MPNEFIVKNGLIVGGNVVTSGTITINGALAATQSWVTSQAYLTSASLSGYATQSYVTSALAALVDAAPAALDTLNELAAALGDDANFSTTITNSIASKLSLTGGTLTGALNGTSASFSSNVTLGNNADLVFVDLAGTFPTTGKGFDWTLNNDGARIYAVQPGSDSIDLVFQLRDNATTNDRFVFWVDEWQGPAYDKYPLIISGGTEFDLKDSSLYTNTVLRLSNSGVLQNVTGNISMFTNNAGYLTSYTETDTLATVTGRGATTSTNISVNTVILGTDATYGGAYRSVSFGYNGDSYNRILAANNTSDGMYFMAATGQGFNFRPNGGTANLVVINSAGNLGIGTTTPLYKLDVVGAIRSNASNVGTLNLGTDSYSSTYLTAQVIGQTSPSYTSTGKLSFKVLTWGAGSDYGPTEQMYIDVTGPDTKTATLVMLPWGGNVGIGTTAPGYKLDINGNSRTTGIHYVDTYLVTPYIYGGGPITMGNDVIIDSTSAWNASAAMLNVGGTGDGRIQVRHIYGKSAESAAADHLWLQYQNTGNHVQIGAGSEGNNLYVSGNIYMNGYFGGNLVATQSWVNSQGFLTSVSDIWVNTAGDTMTGTLSFAQPVGLGFANGQYIKDNSSGGLIIYSGAAVGITGTSIAVTGAATFSSSLTVGSRLALQPSNFGYSSGYKTLLIGSAGTDYTTNAVSLAFNVDVSGNPSGAFTGNGYEYIWRNTGAFITPNAANTTYNTLFTWNSSGQLTFPAALTVDTDILTRTKLQISNGRLFELIGSSTALNIYDASAGASRIYITSVGKVGIGTTAPAEEFHVLGRAIFDGGSGDSSTDAVVYVTKSNNNDWGLYINAAALDYAMYARVSPSAGYALTIHNGTTWTTRITGNAVIYLGEKNAIEGNYDTWLRLNNQNHYASGVYTPGVMRADGGFYVSGSTVLHTGNYNSYTPTLGGTGASGTWSISVTGSAGSATTSSSTYRGIIEDTRAAQRTPDDYEDYRASWEFTNQITGLSGWKSAMTLQGWHNNYSAWQIIGGSDTSLTEDWYLRSGNVTTWNPVRRIWHSGDFTSTNVSNWNTAYGWGNHASQSYATTSYVTTQINNLINGAPGVLDTLDELAAALGDDANFATTVTNSIAGKVSKSGDTMTGNLTTTGLTVGNGVATGRQPYGPLANANIVLNSSAADSSGVCGIEFLSGNNYPSDGASIYFQNNAGGGSERAKLTLRVENDQEDFIELRAGKVVINANTYSGGGQNPAVIFQHNDSQIVSITSGGQIDASGGNSSQWNTAYGWGNHSSAGYALNSSLANYLPLSGGVIGGGVTINGNLTVNGTITENSSLKLKENIETSEGNLQKVVNLRPVTYNKIESQTTELGLIAEEVAEVYPEFVQYDENGEPVGVHYSRLTAALIGAVKELTNQVQELNKKING
jgi:hypothetical protein